MDGEKSEERIWDSSRTWGSPEGVQGHGGAPPRWLWQRPGKTLRKKSNPFLASLALTPFQSTAPLPSKPEHLSFL